MAERVVLKTPEQIAKMREAGRVVAQVLAKIGDMAVPGITTEELDKAVEKHILESGGIPLFKGVPSGSRHPDFPASICASVNEVVVHGIPGPQQLKDGDIISIDVGVELDGWCGDAARTYAVGNISRKAQKLLDVTKAALFKGIEHAKAGRKLKDISGAVQAWVESHGFSVVRQFVGHGIGREMHEAPQIPNYVCRPNERLDGFMPELKLVPGMVLAIEPMVNIGGWEVLVDKKDGWTVRSKDRSLSAHFEHTVAITENGPQILTEL